MALTTDSARPRDSASFQAQTRGLLALYKYAYTTLTRCKDPGQLLELDTILLNTVVRRPGPHPRQSDLLTGLARGLLENFDESDELQDLSDDFFLRLETLDRWRNCGEHTRFFQDQSQGGAMGDIFGHDIKEAHKISGLSHSRNPSDIGGMGSGPPRRFPETSSADGRQTANRPASSSQPDRLRLLKRLAAALETRFGHSGQLEDLNEAIALYQVASRAVPEPDRPNALHSLANALKTRSDWTGRRADLDEAVLLNREVLDMLRSSPVDQSYAISKLAVTLHKRYVMANEDKDMEESMDLLDEALELRASSHPDRPLALTDLASVLLAEYSESDSLDDLDRAIALIREALSLQPHPDTLHSLANAICQRYNHGLEPGDPRDRDEVASLTQEAIALKRQAAERLPAFHPYQSILAHGIADSLVLRFKVLQEFSCLEEAFTASKDSIRMLPEGHPACCQYSAQLGNILEEMYDVRKELGYLDASAVAYRAATACKSASALERFNVAKAWIDATSKVDVDDDGRRHGSALEAYQTAIGLRGSLAPLGLDLQSRLLNLKDSEEIVASAAAYAAKSGKLDKAVEFLEHGRAIFWSQALQLRFSTDQIQTVAPELERKLVALSRALEQGSLRDVSRDDSDTQQKVIAIEREAIHFRRLNEDWEATVKQVRQLEGFEDFLRPKPFSRLQRAASNGPIVILVDPGLYDEEDTFNALIMTSSGVELVPLPLMTLEYEDDLVELLQTMTLPDGDDEPITKTKLNAILKGFGPLAELRQRTQTSIGLPQSRGTRQAPRIAADVEDTFWCILAILWKAIVEPVMHSLDLEKSDSPPRLWWYPTGKLALLPIHAAGIYSLEGNDCVSDYVISSYTPTLNTLLTPQPSTKIPLKMMAVIQPETPGYASLPFTRDELRNIEQYVPKECLITLGTPRAPASADQVFSHLSDISILHLACHGERGEDSALDNAFVLGGAQKLKVSRIMELPMPNASLAYLSACHTATDDDESPDEVVNLAASLLFAGFRGTVATRWSIADEDGPKVADSFYSCLFDPDAPNNKATPPHPDTTQAARALHLAIAKLRADKSTFKRWVPFIHLGL